MAAFMEVWLAWLKLGGFLYVLRDVLDEYFRASTSEKIFFVWVEFERLNRDTLMDLCGRNAPFTHQLLRVALCEKLFQIPKRDCAVVHTTSNDSKLIDLINPVKCRELSWTLGHSNHF